MWKPEKPKFPLINSPHLPPPPTWQGRGLASVPLTPFTLQQPSPPPFWPPQAHQGLEGSRDSLAASSTHSQTLGPRGSSSDLIVLAPDLPPTLHLASTSWEKDRKCTSNYSLRGKEGGSVPAHWLQAVAAARDPEGGAGAAKPRSDWLPCLLQSPILSRTKARGPLIRKTLGGRAWGTAT